MHRIIVIGRGLVGSAAGRHLSALTDGVVVLGPDEPTLSTASVFPASTFLPTLNPIEPPWYGPYARWCGRGGAARCPPIPIDAPKATFTKAAGTVWVGW